MLFKQKISSFELGLTKSFVYRIKYEQVETEVKNMFDSCDAKLLLIINTKVKLIQNSIRKFHDRQKYALYNNDIKNNTYFNILRKSHRLKHITKQLLYYHAFLCVYDFNNFFYYLHA